MKKNLLFLSALSIVAHHASYSMQNEDDSNSRQVSENKGLNPLEELSYGYREIEGLLECKSWYFKNTINALESFWNDKNSCENVVYALCRTIAQFPDNGEQNYFLHQYLLANFHIILGSAKAARDLARKLSAKSDSDLLRMKALSRATILKQAHVNLEYVKHLSRRLRKNDYHPLHP